MKHCEQCNQNFTNDFNFCLSCGNPIKETVATGHSRQTTGARETFIQCEACKNFVRTDAWRCEYCGTALGGVDASASSRPDPPPTQYVQPPQWHPTPPSSQTSPEHSGFSGGVTPTRVAMPTAPIRNEPTTPSLTGYQPYGAAPATRSSSFRWWHGMLLLVFFVGVIGIAAVGSWWWLSNRDSTTDNNRNTAASETNSSGPSTSQAKAEPTVSQNSADADLRRLQERIRNAKPSDSEVFTSITDAEDKYPNDYRFTYERAKLIGKKLISHDEAWTALRRAAEKAIDNGKAQEMSDDMTARERSELARLSSHPAEWNEIIEALNTGDKTSLKNSVH